MAYPHNGASFSQSPSSSPFSPSPRPSFIAFMKRRLSDFGAPKNPLRSQRPGSRKTMTNNSSSSGLNTSENSHRNNVADDSTLSRTATFPFPTPSNIQPDHTVTGYQDHLSIHEPSLHRAGLLRPKSYNPTSSLAGYSLPGSPPPSQAYQHSRNTIRLTTMQLSNMPFRSSLASMPSDKRHRKYESISPMEGIPASAPPNSRGPSRERINASSLLSGPQQGIDSAESENQISPHPLPLDEPIASAPILHNGTLPTRSTDADTTGEGITGASAPPVASTSPSKAASASLSRAVPEIKTNAFAHPSGLTLLRPEPSSRSSTPPPLPSIPGSDTPITRDRTNPSKSTFDSEHLGRRDRNGNSTRGEVSERTPLIIPVQSFGTHSQAGGTLSQPGYISPDGIPSAFSMHLAEWRKVLRQKIFELPMYSRISLAALPAVLLGCLLNILDGVSYGMIIFPSTGVFADLAPMGVSLFFVSAVVAQLTYVFGGSGFAGANGSMMIEVVPFFHMIATGIATEIGEEHPREVIATTLVAFSLSSILTGLSFFLLGALKLGVIVGFFPRHILVGCIGGIGAFLIKTGLIVSMRMNEEEFTMSLETLRTMFLDLHTLMFWTLPLALAVLLRIITHKYQHQLIFPLYFLAIPIIFYIVVAVARLDLGQLQQGGWLFDLGRVSQAPWYQFYDYLDYHLVRLGPLWSTLPTQFALLFFNILHPPLNVPALAVSLNDDVDTNKELVGHGYSNLLSGLVGSVPNYLVYVNTLLFYRVGGNNRIAGFLLALATAILLFLGTGPIAYIPVLVVGALIYVLGIDLVKEALWDTRHRVSRTEYITIVSIMIVMTVWDFVIGVLFGIVVSCFFFVVQNSRGKSIRAIYTGESTMSAVRRPILQRAYIREVAKQTTILRLQGFLFFGTIAHVEETIRRLIEGSSWQKNPVQFLVVDLTLVAGVDMSSTEAFLRIHRLLTAKSITLVFCGFDADSAVGKALHSVDVLGAEGVELFSTFNEAMEWTENEYLRSWFRSHKIETSPIALPVPLRRDSDLRHTAGSDVLSPRRLHMHNVGNKTIGTEFVRSEPPVPQEPLNTLSKAFPSYWDIDSTESFTGIIQYFSRITVPTGHVLWSQGNNPDGLYIIESGVLRATYEFANQTQRLGESMVPGTVAGELSALSNSPRNATCIVEHHATLWKMSMQDLDRLRREEPPLSALFTQLVLKAAKTDYDILLSAIVSRQ